MLLTTYDIQFCLNLRSAQALTILLAVQHLTNWLIDEILKGPSIKDVGQMGRGGGKLMCGWPWTGVGHKKNVRKRKIFKSETQHVLGEENPALSTNGRIVFRVNVWNGKIFCGKIFCVSEVYAGYEPDVHGLQNGRSRTRGGVQKVSFGRMSSMDDPYVWRLGRVMHIQHLTRSYKLYKASPDRPQDKLEHTYIYSHKTYHRCST